MTTELEIALEKLIDKHGLPVVLETLASVCFGKSEELASNWEAQRASRFWDKAGTKVLNLSNDTTILLVEPE